MERLAVAKAFEVSSNTGLVKIIDENYKNNPKKFIKGLYDMDLNHKLDLPIIGEARTNYSASG